MTEYTIKNWQGEEVGNTSLELQVARPENAAHIVHRAIVRHLAQARQGNASTKTRAEVRGGGRKPWRQKGTGRARAGSIRSPLWRGGGVSFGPKPRDYSQKMNRKERQLALRTALNNQSERFVIVENFISEVTQPKTKEFAAALSRWGVGGKDKVLVILPEIPQNLYLSARNLCNVKLIRADSINIYDVMQASKIIATSDSLLKIQEVYGG